MTQNEAKSRFTARQLKIAEALANPEFNMSKSQLAKHVGVSRSTLYRILKNKDFLDYVSSLIDIYTDIELSDVWKALLIRCKCGDIQAIKLYFELKGKYKQEIRHDVNAQIQIIDDIPKCDVDES